MADHEKLQHLYTSGSEEVAEYENLLGEVIKKQFKPQGTKEKTIALGSIVPSLNGVKFPHYFEARTCCIILTAMRSMSFYSRHINLNLNLDKLAFVAVCGCVLFLRLSCANETHLKEAIQIVEQENWLNPKGMAPGCLFGGALVEFVGMILQMTHGLLKRAAASL